MKNDIYCNSNSRQIASKPKPKRIRFKDENSYTKRLLITHIITSSILFLSCLFHLVAICTNEWFYLNANGYNSNYENENVANGGLWSFCSYSSPSSSSFAQPYIYSNVKSKTCMSYEQYQLDTNMNTRLTSSRILIVFTFVLNVIVLVLFEIVASIGIGCLIHKQQGEVNMNNIVILNKCFKINTTRYPQSYFLYVLAVVLSIIFSFVSIVLLLTGFGLYESFIESLNGGTNSFNSMRGYSYWLIVAGIALLVTYFFIKLWCLYHVIKMTRRSLIMTSLFKQQKSEKPIKPSIINMIPNERNSKYLLIFLNFSRFIHE